MSTLKVGNINSLTASTPPTINDSAGNQVGTFCRAWVNFNGSTATVRASFNVSSVTRNSTGDLTLNFTNSLGDSNYTLTGVASQSTGGQPNVVMAALATASSYVLKTTSSIRIYTTDTDGIAPQDCFDANVAIFR
jgi:hypothetical protein